MTNNATKPAPSRSPQPALVVCEVGDPGIPGVESYSMFCLKVHRALRVLGMTAERRHGRSIDEFAHLNPAKQVPVLLIDGEPVPDSTDIVQALDDLAGGGVLIPTDPMQRAEALLWEELADTSINGFVVALRWAEDRNWPRARDAFFGAVPEPARADVAEPIRERVVASLYARNVWRPGAAECWRRFGDLLDQLEQVAPESGFWTGGKINVADLAIFAQLHSLRVDLTPWQHEQLDARPRLTAFLDRVQGRTAPQ